MFREFESESREIFQTGHKLEVHKAQISHGLKVYEFWSLFCNFFFLHNNLFTCTLALRSSSYVFLFT